MDLSRSAEDELDRQENLLRPARLTRRTDRRLLLLYGCIVALLGFVLAWTIRRWEGRPIPPRPPGANSRAIWISTPALSRSSESSPSEV